VSRGRGVVGRRGVGRGRRVVVVGRGVGGGRIVGAGGGVMAGGREANCVVVGGGEVRAECSRQDCERGSTREGFEAVKGTKTTRRVDKALGDGRDVVGVLGERGHGDAETLNVEFDSVRSDEVREMRDHFGIGRTDIDNRDVGHGWFGSGRRATAGRCVCGAAETNEAGEDAKVGKAGPLGMALKGRGKLGVDVFGDVMVCTEAGIDAGARRVRAAKEARREAKENTIGFFWKGVDRLKEELCRTSPRVINSKLQSGRRERTSTECGSGEVGRAKNVHALQSKADDGFFKGVSVVADVVGRVGADSHREVEHLSRVVTVGGFGGFVMVENTGSFEVARDGAVVMAIMDGDGLFDEVAERGWGEARGGSRGRDTRDTVCV
jgi:hypothetical protein